MTASDPTLSSLGLDRLIDARTLNRDLITGSLEHFNLRIVGAPAALLHSLRFVLQKEAPGVWQSVLQTSGRASGQAIAQQLDSELTRAGKPALQALPLEACLRLIEQYLSAQGWGRVTLDLTHAAEHGLVMAQLEHSIFADALPTADDFVDPLLAGVLSSFFEHISGQLLACEEIACVRRGAPHCTFVITAPERIAAIQPLVGRESAEAIVARLKT